MNRWRVLRGRIERWAAHYHGPRFHALLCDPPYELGFMGRDWDKSGVSFNPETWVALAEHLYPGAFGMAFASSRGWHRLACAIEDAGLIIHPTIWKYWSYGSGFPKATRIDTQVDAAAGAKRKVVGRIRRDAGSKSEHPFEKSREIEFDITAPATPLAAAWEGHRYGLQAIKPAVEPIIVFSKPYEGRPVECIVETGAGALWIDGGRIGTNPGKRTSGPAGQIYSKSLGYNAGTKWQGSTLGRWPANLCLVHRPECVQTGLRRIKGTSAKDNRGSHHTVAPNQICDSLRDDVWVGYADADGLETVDDWECHADCPARALGEQSGVTKSSGGLTPGVGAGDGRVYSFGNEKGANAGGLGDTGTAARFFFQADWALERAEPVHCALCLQPITKHGIMNETQEENMPCNANGAEESLSPPDESSDSVPTVAQQPGLLDGAGRSGKSSIPASSVEKSSSSTLETIESSAPRNAELTLAERCALSVKSVVSLCDSCATAIAQRLAQMLHDHAQGLPLSPVFTEESRQQILFLSLVQSVASLDSSDTTRIMQSQKRLNGFVIHAIRGSTKSTELQSLIPLPFHESVMEKLDTAEPVFYQSKAGRAERDAGLGDMPQAVGHNIGTNACARCGRRVKHNGSGVGCECGAQRETIKLPTGRNPHPTVKPLTLCKWLATLLLPPQEYAPRRILVPFAGSGSEMIGALLAGWDLILGIEMLAENVALAEARLAWWADKSRWGQTDPAVLLREREPDDGQLELWSV